MYIFHILSALSHVYIPLVTIFSFTFEEFDIFVTSSAFHHPSVT